MTKSKLLLYGAGGHAKVVTEIAERNDYQKIVFYEDNPTRQTFLGYPILSTVEEGISCVFTIGSNEVRKKLALSLNVKFVTLVHPRSSVSPRSKIADGTVVMAGVSINSEAMVGKHCIINTNASVDHDCVIEDYVHLSPNVALAGNVTIGEGTHVGIGAC